MSSSLLFFSRWSLFSGLRQRWTSTATSTAARAAFALTVLFVAGGLLLRARGYLFSPTAFWLDECSWAMRIFDRPLVQSLIRPIGFLAVSKFLASTLSNTESVLRLLPWVAGVAATLTVPFVARALFRTLAARVLFVAVIALSPLAIDFSKEFKPYSLSLALHLALVLLTLRYVRSERPAELAWVLLVAAIGSLFAQDLVFAFPGVFSVVALTARKRGRAELGAVCAVALLIIAGLALQYLLMWKNLPRDHTEFWGKKYNVFYTPRATGGYLGWSLPRFEEMIAMPGIRRMLWSAGFLTSSGRALARSLDQLVWVGSFVAGVAVIVRQRRVREGALVLLPLLLLWLFNRAGFWPLGAFRTNVFTVVYSGAVAATAFDTGPAEQPAWRACAPVLLLVCLPLALFERSWHEQKRFFTYDSTFPRALDWLAAKEPASPGAPRELVVFDRRSCDPYRYYTRYNRRVARRVADAIARKYVVKCSNADDALPADLLAPGTSGRRFAVLHVTRPFDRLMRRGRFQNLRVVQREDVGSHTVVALMPEAPERKPPVEISSDDAVADQDDD
jgi:hypothetical protein